MPVKTKTMKKKVFIGETKLTYHKAKKVEKKQIRQSRTAFKILRELMGDLVYHQEAYAVLYLNQANEVMWAEILHLGGSKSCIQDVKAIVRRALVGGCQSMIVGHNHPSGNLTPSEADKRATKSLKEALHLFEIPLHDHIIVGDEGFFSFSDHGLSCIS